MYKHINCEKTVIFCMKLEDYNFTKDTKNNKEEERVYFTSLYYNIMYEYACDMI